MSLTDLTVDDVVFMFRVGMAMLCVLLELGVALMFGVFARRAQTLGSRFRLYACCSVCFCVAVRWFLDLLKLK